MKGRSLGPTPSYGFPKGTYIIIHAVFVHRLKMARKYFYWFESLVYRKCRILWGKIAKSCSCHAELIINSPVCICNAIQVRDGKSSDCCDCMLTINVNVMRHRVQVF